MTRLEIRWPDESAERIRVARGRLERAGETLRSRSFEDRLAIVARVVADWTAVDSPWRRELAEVLGECSGFHPDTVRKSLDAALLAWRSEDLTACARRELSGLLASPGQRLAPFRWTAILAGGLIPMPTLLSGLLPLILGSPVLMRPTTEDPVTASLLKRSLAARDEALANAFESVSFPAHDPALDELLAAPCVVATGSDETIRSISARLGPDQRFVAHGHRFSIVVLGGGIDRGTGGLEALAEAIALDVARWDQTGCLSPVLVHLVDIEPGLAEACAREIAAGLERLSSSMPRGEVPIDVLASQRTEAREAQMRAAGDGTRCFVGPDHCVVLEADAQPRPAPLHRFLRLVPVESLNELERSLRPYGRHLSNVAHAGLSESQEVELERRLVPFGANRFTRPGRLQTPPIDWPHDGMPLLTPLAGWLQRDPWGSC
ncbi:MAG TPA: hypothetical protein ENI85_17200 [Deltaproteobacteria bacterium]|nr:hypothetical protein [Deltaproteobacteria bacterium]